MHLKRIIRITALIVAGACLGAGLLACATPGRPAVDTSIGPRPLEEAEKAITAPREPDVVPVSAAPADPLSITVEDAVVMVLANNRSLAVEKYTPAIRKTAEDEERAAFDPVIGGGVSRYREKSEIPGRTTRESLTNEIQAGLGVSEFLPTGTDVEVALLTERTWSDLYTDDLYGTRIGLSATQALLRGVGLQYNLARLRQARIDTRASQYELRGFAEALVGEVEETYWDYALIERQIEIFLESLRLAEQQKKETEEMVRIGTLAESELTAAEAEIALRREGLINARSNLEKTRLALLRLLNPSDGNLWQRTIEILYEPQLPEVTLDEVESHVGVALRMRPDLNQSRLQVERGDLDIARTKNGLLPKMDLFITFGKTGYADSFGRSVDDIDGDSYDMLAGLSLEYPFVNRGARARYERARLTRRQTEEAVENLAQLVQVDVRSAYIEVTRTREQIAATAATRALQEEKARIEREKFRVGKSTTLMVAQAQRDFLESRISEIQAITNYLKALVSLYRLEGSLLERRGIVIE